MRIRLALGTLLFTSTLALLPSVKAQLDEIDGWLNLTIIHTNDIHSRVDPANTLGTSCTDADEARGNCYGGAARHKTMIERLRQGKKHSLLLDGGDEFQGTLFYSYFKGNVTAPVMNALGYDLTTIGNHEWDDGPENLVRFWQKLKMPVVCANVDFSKNPDLQQYVKPYHIFEDLRVGIIGYTTPTTGNISHSGPTISFTDPIPAVQKYVDELQAKGINRIIALSHHGYLKDMEVAAKTRGVDLIVGGHSHSYLGDASNPLSKGPYPTVVKDLNGDNTLIVQAFCWGRYIGDLDIVFNPEGKIVSWEGGPILVEHSIPGDLELLKEISGWRREFESWSSSVLGVASDDFTLDGCRYRDCYMGNLVADTMLNHVRDLIQKRNLVVLQKVQDRNARRRRGKRERNAFVAPPITTIPWVDFAIMNSGGIRSGIAKGNVTVEDIMTTSPFSDKVIQFSISGQELLSTLEAVAIQYHRETQLEVSSFIQVSGLRFVYDSTKVMNRTVGGPALLKAEVQDMNKRWRRVAPKTMYSAVSLSFVVKGGDNIFAKYEGGRPGEEISHGTIDAMLMARFRSEGYETPYVDGRIEDVGKPGDKEMS